MNCNIMKSTTENVVECVNSILKTLECSICLELMKNPVSTGCGHFFCRFCITEALQSNYRAPCPLCKKSFTRRGMQDAHQRKSILVAVKKLADTCEKFADVKFFNKGCSQREEIVDKTMPILFSVENRGSVTEKVTRTSTRRKRKSNEKEKEAILNEMNDSLPVLEKIGYDRIDKPLEDGKSDSSNDEVIPTSNKRCRQSVEDSDSDDLPDLESLFQDCSVLKISQEQSLKAKNNPLPTIAFAPKSLDLENYKNVNNEQNIESGTKNVLSTLKTNLKNSTSMLPKKYKPDIQNADKSSNQQINTRDSNCLKIVHKRRFKAQNLKEKNKNHPLRNKTNELNVSATPQNNINISLNVMDEVVKNTNSVVLEKIDETEGNEEMVKENKNTNDVALFISPEKNVCNKNDLKNLRSPQKKIKTPKFGKKDQASSSEEENLIKKLNEAENFELTISKNTIPSTILVNNSEIVKESYILNEINLPELKEVEKTAENIKKGTLSDDIADTAISVQTVASPETSKMELGSKSPGWSKVKQVGKDFRVKKFSKLSVEKNMSHSCPADIPCVEQTKSLSSESLGNSKFKKILNSNISKDISNEDLSKNSECSKGSKNALFENEVVSNKQFINHLEQISDGERQMEMTEVSSELGKCDQNLLAKNCDEIEYQTKMNLHSADIENCFASDVSTEVNKKEKNNIPIVSGCSLLKRPNTISLVSTSNHILPDFQFSSISDDKKETLKSIQNNVFNTGADYETENKCLNDEENMEVDNFNVNDEHLEENEAFCNPMLKNETVTQTLSDTNLHNEVCNSNEINSNLNFQDHNEYKHCYIDNALPNEKLFAKPNPKISSNTSIIKDNKLLSRISKISKCEITATKSIFDEDENVYYTEHSQQTSQRLLEFCNNVQRKQNSFTGPVASINAPFYYAPNTLGIVAKRNSWCNQVENCNPMRFRLGPQNNEKTKVLKRTCLTFEEIQEAFTKSSISGATENICSLLFSSGDFRLHVCVSEETLNISVLKVVDSEIDAPDIIQTKNNVDEKDIQISNNNSRVNSPVEILPSSNIESESSEPDQGQSDGNSKMENNIFPYLNKYFPDSEPGDQVHSDVKESLLNNSEIIQYQASMQSLNKNGNSVNLEEAIKNDFQENISLNINNKTLSSLQSPKSDENDKMETNESNEISVAMESKTDINIPTLNDSSESLPPTQPYLGSKQNTAETQTNDMIMGIIEPINEISEKTFSPSHKITELTDSKLEKQNIVYKTNQLLKHKELELDEFMSDDEENITFDDLVSYQKSESPNKLEINDSDGLSSDPAMAFATQLVAPLKNIAAKITSAERINNLKKQAKDKSSSEVFNSKEKRSLQEFEELVLNLNKNSANDSSVSKSSRLSLKSKRTAKKFKRIQKFDSDDDSDSAHSSKDELCAAKHSLIKDSVQDAQVASSKIKENELTCESLPEQNTLNSFLSEDITNKDPNQLAKEVEVLDKEIYSVVEQLKQYGREDVLKYVLDKLHTESEKESPVSEKSDEKQCISDDSEDSTDIFSQSVPPTPPDNEASKNDSIFKSSHCKHN